MNERNSRGFLVETWLDLLALLRNIGRLARRYYGWALATAFVSAGCVWLMFPHDRAWLDAVQSLAAGVPQAAHNVAWELGKWGDYPTYNLPVSVLIWLIAAWKKNRAWRNVALVCFLGASLGGVGDDLFRLTLGRPRPDVYPHVADGFYGPAKALLGRYESFPSGHAASDVGMAVALLFVARPLGLLAAVFAGAVIWGRMELNKHYPSDVLVGTLIGLSIGVLVGMAGRIESPGPS